MSNCITCGGSFVTDFNSIVGRKKQIYDKTGQEYYVYKVSETWNITRKEYFKKILQENNVAEYFHISEFRKT